MAVTLKNVSKRYDTLGNTITALDRFSLELRDGDFVAVMGESGSGKTTLLNALCGMLRVDSGEIIIDGIDICALNDGELAKYRRNKIGVIYQFYNLIPELNIIDNVSLPRELDGRDADKEYLKEVIERVGLSGRERDFPSSLSGGQQQRAAIARAVYQKPKLLLADEPTGNLDDKNTNEILELLSELNKTFNITIVIVTHSNAVAARAKRIITIENGRLKEDVRR